MYEIREIRQALADGGKTEADVRFVQDPWGGQCTWEEFLEAVKALEQHPRESWYPTGENVDGFVFMGDGWWVDRWLDDGRADHGWSFRTLPVRNPEAPALRASNRP